MTRSLRRAAIALSFLLAACTPSAAPTASGPEKVTITDKTASELVAVMNAWETALGKKDLTGFQATIDLTRAAFRRCQSETFDIAARQGFTPFEVTVAKVEPYLETYARAYVGDDTNGYSRMYFRREGGKWIRSEPLDTELGGDQTKTIDGLQLSYYGIDNDVIDKYAAAGNEARAFLLKQAEGHTSTGQAFGLRIFPTRGAAGPNVACSVAGFGLENVPNDPFVRLFSNALSFKAGLATVTESTSSIIRHEGLHWLQDQFIPGIGARTTVLAGRGLARLRRPIAERRGEEERPLQHAGADLQTARGRRAAERRRHRPSLWGSTTRSRTRWSSTCTRSAAVRTRIGIS